MEPLFFVKFGRKEYLQRIIDGKIYFSNAKRLREIENIQFNKGQGDKGEGKITIHVIKAEIRDPTTHVLIDVLEDIDVILDFEQIETMPVFCLTAIYEIDCIKTGFENTYRIALTPQQELDIRTHFNEADSALIIKKPNIFIDEIMNFFEGKCYASMVNYYDTSKLTSDRISFLLDISRLENKSTPKYSITTENAYKNLYCKDLFFNKQQEFRFVASDIRISEPQEFDVKTRSEMTLIDIDTFFNGVEITN